MQQKHRQNSISNEEECVDDKLERDDGNECTHREMQFLVAARTPPSCIESASLRHHQNIRKLCRLISEFFLSELRGREDSVPQEKFSSSDGGLVYGVLILLLK